MPIRRLFASALALLMLIPPLPARSQDGTGAAEPPGFAEKAAAIVAPYARSGIFSGAVIVARNGRPLFRRAYGFADREWGIANTPETRFRIGSITKQFTAAAILKLAEAGKLALDDPAARHAPGLPPSWGAITIRMLLDHSSGLPNVTALPDYAATLSRIERAPMETLALLFGEDLLFPPGAGHEYSNTGYILLAAIVERITGQPFERYLSEAILAPAGLRDTGDGDPGAILARRASGYRRAFGEWRNAAPLAASAPSGAGALTSTVDDLVAWDRALLAGAALAPASVTAMAADAGHGYGLGLYVGAAYGHRLLSHGGFINGFSAIKDSYPDVGLTVAILGNAETAPAQAMARALEAAYFGSEPRSDIAVADAVLARYAGFYRLGPRSILTVAREGDRLVAQATGEPPLALTAESDRIFATEGGASRIAFDIEPDGRPTGAMLDGDGRVRSGPRIDLAQARRITARRVARLAPRP